METTIEIGLDIIALLIFDFLRENRWFLPFFVHIMRLFKGVHRV
jgi:hypothetical protein